MKSSRIAGSFLLIVRRGLFCISCSLPCMVLTSSCDILSFGKGYLACLHFLWSHDILGCSQEEGVGTFHLFVSVQVLVSSSEDGCERTTCSVETRLAKPGCCSEEDEKGALCYKVITLTAKEKICFCEKPECNPDYCPYAKGHFDRINDAVYEMITTSDDMSRQAVEEQAKKWQVCPFELGLDLSLWQTR